MFHVIDAYKAFYPIYQNITDPLKRFEAWNLYMNQFLEIKSKCISDYEANDIDFKEIALKKVFDHDEFHFNKMDLAYVNLLEIIDQKRLNFNGLFHLDFKFNIIIYHGLGNAAGWASFYEKTPSIYLGIEKIAELSWTDQQTLIGLIMHEYAHLAHANLRVLSIRQYESLENDPYFRLYSEGFATFYEDLMNQGHKSRSPWFLSCLKKEEDFKKIYLTEIEKNKNGWTKFYGDWHEIINVSDVGYFLGYRMIQSVASRMTLKEIAKLSIGQIKALSMTYLSTISPVDESLEFWDAYDQNEQKTGMILQRGKKISEGLFHIVVECIITNQYDEILLTRRGPNKSYPLMWELPGGSILCGESATTGLIREVKEETGIIVLEHHVKLIDTQIERFSILKIFIAKVLDPKVFVDHHETVDYQWIKYQDFLNFIEEDQFTLAQKNRFKKAKNKFEKETDIK
jgi:8-oxo-dGTP diphosphatase